MPRPHPAKRLIKERGESIAHVARACDYARSVSPFTRVLNGHVAPWPEFRRRVSEYLRVPEHEAFHDVPAPTPKRTRAKAS